VTPWTRIARFVAHGRDIGFLKALRLKARWLGVLEVRDPDLAHPMYLRPGTSDWWVYRTVVREREFGPLDDLRGVDFILDLGANVGYASAYLLSRFPNARCLAVEPDPENFVALERNLAPFGNRATCLRAGVWNRNCFLTLADDAYRGGGEDSRQVVECGEETPNAIPGHDIPTLMRMAGAERIGLCKIDIEGAEAKLLGQGDTEWLDLVDNFTIEIHDDSAFGPVTPLFRRAMGDQVFALSTSGELVIGRRIATTPG